MPNILILGANGQLARHTIFSEATGCSTDPVPASGKSSQNPDPARVTIVEGDVLDTETLKSAM